MHWLLLIGFAMMWLPVILVVLARTLWEQDVAQGEAESGKATFFDTTPFFSHPRPRERFTPTRPGGDPTVIRLEDYLRAEHEEAERFVSRPSVGSLYRNCGQGF